MGPAGLPLRLRDPRLLPNHRGYSELPPGSSSWHGSARSVFSVWGLTEDGWQPVSRLHGRPTVPTQ